MNGEGMSIEFDESGQPVASEFQKTPQKPGVRELKEAIAALQLDNEILKNDLEKAREEGANFLDLAQRSRAEFENYKKRTAENTAKVREDGVAEGLMKILPAYDALSQAANFVTDENTLKGLRMVIHRLIDTLIDAGVEVIPSAGRDFDPAFHNAVMNEETDDAEKKGKVTEVFQEGFKMGNRVLRYAMVKVAV